MNHHATAALLSPSRGPTDEDDQGHPRQSNHQTHQQQAAHLSGATPRTRPAMTQRKPSFTQPTNRRTSSRTAPIPSAFAIDIGTGCADIELDIINLVTDPKYLDTSCSSLSQPEGSLSSLLSPIPSAPVVSYDRSSTRKVSSRVSELRREMSHTRGWTDLGYDNNNNNNNNTTNNNNNSSNSNNDPMKGSESTNSGLLMSPTTIMSARVGIPSSKSRKRTSTTTTTPPSATTSGSRSPQPTGMVETIDHGHTGWSRIPSKPKKHTGTSTTRGADLQRVEDRAGAGVDHPGSPSWRRIPPKRKSHTSSLVPDAQGVEDSGGTEQEIGTVWRRIPIKTTNAHPAGRLPSHRVPTTVVLLPLLRPLQLLLHYQAP